VSRDAPSGTHGLSASPPGRHGGKEKESKTRLPGLIAVRIRLLRRRNPVSRWAFGGEKLSGNSQYDDGAGKSGFCLLTVSDEALVFGDRARLGNVPWGTGLGPLGITHIGARLIDYRDSVDGHHAGVSENGE
jgi:hypothetical protein